MSINISNITLSSNFNLTNTSGVTTMLRDFKINGRYIDKIYWCDPDLFSNQPDYCGLIYKRYSNIIPIILSGQIYDLLTNVGLDNATITLDRLYTRVPSSWTANSYNLGENGEDPGYYYISGIYGNSSYKVTVQRKGYATYIDTGYSLKSNDIIQDFYINPIDDSISRILLYWNQTPADLDLYVICPDGNMLSVRNDTTIYGYVNVTQNNQYGPEIISLNTYVNFDDPLKVGGTFDIYSRWTSSDDNNASAMNSEIKIFTQQFGIKSIKNDALTDNINREGTFWNAAKLHIKSGIQTIELTDSDLITYTTPLNLDVLQKLGSQFSYFQYYYYDYLHEEVKYPGVIENTIDNNRFVLYQHAIYYLLKDYPFKTRLVTSRGQISNYAVTVTDNYDSAASFTSQNSYKAYIKFSNFNISNSTVSAYFYLNENMKQYNEPFAMISVNDVTNSLSINIRSIFYNKCIPLVILDKNNQPLKNFQYRFTDDINSTYRQRYIIKKNMAQNEYFLIRNVFQDNCKFKFTLGIQKQIKLQDLISTNDTEIPSSFNKLYPFVYRNTCELNGFKTKVNDQNNKLYLYGNLQQYSQRYFNPDWISNYTEFDTYYEDYEWDGYQTDYGDEDYDDMGYNYDFKNKLNDFYLYSYSWDSNNWPFRNQHEDKIFSKIKKRISYINQKDQYKIHILNYNNYISGATLPISDINIQYINKEVKNVRATAGNKYLGYDDLDINDSYILNSISSAINGKLKFTYQWNPNGINVSFMQNAPNGQNCIFEFKRLYTSISRQNLYGMLRPKVYIRSKQKSENTVNYSVTFTQNNLVVDFYQEISGFTEGFNCAYIDFNQMYKLKTQIVDTYTSYLNLSLNFVKQPNIKQYIGYKILIWQNSQHKIARSFEGMTLGDININCPQLISNKDYTVDIYTTYRRYHGNLSGIYERDFQSYRKYYYQEWDGQDYIYLEDYYNEYATRSFQENIFKLDSFTVNLNGNGTSVTKKYTLPYGQFAGTIYTLDGKKLHNDAGGTVILKHQSLDIQYNCAWSDSSIWSIDYIYPGTYYLEVTYANIIIYTDFIEFSKDNINETTTKRFNSSAGFKTLKFNIYNQQTNELALHCPPLDEQLNYNDSQDFSYRLRVMTKDNLSQNNELSSLTNEVQFYNNITSADDQTITTQAYINSIYLFELSAASYLSIPISKLTHENSNINAVISNNSALIQIADPSLVSNQTIRIWSSYWYWRYFYAHVYTYQTYGYDFYFNGINIEMYDQNDNPISLNNKPYIFKSYITDIDDICAQSTSDHDFGMDMYIQSIFQTDDYKHYQKTGKYKLKYFKRFGNSDKNNDVLLAEKQVSIYDNNYSYTNIPEGYPYKYIKIRPTFLANQNGLSGFLKASSFSISNLSGMSKDTSVSSYLSCLLRGQDNVLSGKTTANYVPLSCILTGNDSMLSGLIYYRYNNQTLTGKIETNNITKSADNNISFSLVANLKGNKKSCKISSKLAGKLINGIKCEIPKNTYISIPMFCGNSKNISDFEIADYCAVYHNMEDYPTWAEDYYGGYNDVTKKMYIIDQLNYWIGAYNIFTTRYANDPLNIIGLYPSGEYVNNSFIYDKSQSTGYEAKCGQETGIYIQGNDLVHTQEYVLLIGTSNKIVVGGYLADVNHNKWKSIAFDINVYETTSNTLITSLSGITDERFQIGLIKKGTYRTQIFIAGTTINVINEQDAIQTWNQSTTNSILYRTSITVANITSYMRYTNKDTSTRYERSVVQLQLLDDKLKYYRQLYTHNGGSSISWYQLIAGNYKIKYKWNLASITLKKSELNLNNNKFSISQSKLHSLIPSSYKQPIGQLCLGTILDTDGNILYYKSSISNGILSGEFIKTNINLPDTIKTVLCQQQSVSSIVLNGGYNYFYHIFDHMWSYNIGSYYFKNIPSDSHNYITCNSTDGYISLSAEGTNISTSDLWIKCGTVFNLNVYHDTLKLGEATTTYKINETKSFNWSYPTGVVTANFIDKITNKKLQMNYSHQSDNGYNFNRCMFAYHTNCEQNINQTSAVIINNNVYYNYKSLNSINSSPITTDNLYANENYLIRYRLGNDGQLSAATLITNLPSSGISKTFKMPYGSIRLGKYFRDRNNNANSINSAYATLTLIRQQGDGYDTTYTYNGQNRDQSNSYYNQHIKTGLYKIKLQSNIPGKQPITIQYQKLNMLSANFNIINYINTNPASINCKIINDSHISNTLYIRIWHNGFIYAETPCNYETTLSLFNIPFQIAVIDSNDNIVPIKNLALGKTAGTSYSITNNKISFETTNKTEDFIITI